MNLDELIPPGNEWLKALEVNHPFAWARHGYRVLVEMLDDNGMDGEAEMFLMPNLFILQDCVLILRSPEGYEHGFRVKAGMAILLEEDWGHTIARLDPYA